MGSSSCSCETGASFIKQLWVAREGREDKEGKGRREGKGNNKGREGKT